MITNTKNLLRLNKKGITHKKPVKPAFLFLNYVEF